MISAVAMVTVIVSCLLLPPVFAQESHLDIMVPELMDTDLHGPVKSVDTRISINVSGEFERKLQTYDRIGNLLDETEWNPEGDMISSLTNVYDEAGTYVQQFYMNYDEGFTNEWEVFLSPDTRQIAMKKQNGSAAIYTYSPDRYLIHFRYVGADKQLRKASYTKRDENNRAKEYTRLDERKKPLYTYWFKWKDEGVIDRERQQYRQEEGERLHIYDYLEHDDQGNWTQRLMVRYDIGGKEKEKVFERVVTRTIKYFGEEDEAEDEDEEDAAYMDPTNLVATLHASNRVSQVEDPAETVGNVLTENGIIDENISGTPAGGSAADTSEAEISTADNDDSETFDYTFSDIADKLVIINCKGEAGRSAGSGFIARMNGRTYLFTNQHVIMGADTIQFRTADGEKVIPKNVELSQTRDIARIAIDERDGFEINKRVALGNRIGVFGNSEGAGVATELFGEVTDLGTDLVEVTAEFVSGNSGSPVLDKNQEVIGIASYVKVIWEPPPEDGEERKEEAKTEDDEEGTSKTRRFCYRLDDLEWQPVKWKDYNDKYGKLLRNSETVAANVFEILAIWNDSLTDTIPENSDLAYDLRKWVKKHNDIIDRLNRSGYSSSKSFINAYSGSLKILSDTCHSRARRIRMFSGQRELTGFLRKEFENSADSLDYAGEYITAVSREIQKHK